VRPGELFTDTATQRANPDQTMKSIPTQFTAALLLGALLVYGSTVKAADAKTYQVTGPVLELTDTMIVVQKGDDKWQIARSKNTKVTGELKVGAKVTIHYQMIAVDVEVKAEKKK
jgi:RNase P/RNase MRP subunit p29